MIDSVAAADPRALRGRNVFTAWLGEHSARAARQLFAAAAHRRPTTRPTTAVTGFLHRVRYQRNQELLMETPAGAPGSVRARCRGGATRRSQPPSPAEDPGSTPKRPGPSLPPTAFRCRFASSAADPEEAAAAAADDRLSGRAQDPLARHHSQDRCRRRRAQSAASRSGPAKRRRCSSGSAAHVPRPASTGFSCSRWFGGPARIELLVGLVEDPVFGPVVVFGQGGTAVEIVHDSAVGCRR